MHECEKEKKTWNEAVKTNKEQEAVNLKRTDADMSSIDQTSRADKQL